MQTLTSAQSLTPADPEANLKHIQPNIVGPILMPCRLAIALRSTVLTSVLLAFGISGFAQSQQISAENLSSGNQPEAEAAAAVE